MTTTRIFMACHSLVVRHGGYVLAGVMILAAAEWLMHPADPDAVPIPWFVLLLMQYAIGVAAVEMAAALRITTGCRYRNPGPTTRRIAGASDRRSKWPRLGDLVAADGQSESDRRATCEATATDRAWARVRALEDRAYLFAGLATGLISWILLRLYVYVWFGWPLDPMQAVELTPGLRLWYLFYEDMSITVGLVVGALAMVALQRATLYRAGVEIERAAKDAGSAGFS